ncbi:hypothetical protein JXA80_10675, partial [bacterium]|nr:hypothetical protein [candidate division CSSED10-310 bacterium]
EPFSDVCPVFRSTNGGITWTDLNLNGQWNDIWIHRTRPDRYLLGGDAGLAVSENAGATWSVLDSNHDYYEFIDHPDDPDRIYAVVDSDGVAVTHDGGETWEFRGVSTIPGTDSQSNTRGIALIPGDPMTLLACRRWRTTNLYGEIARSIDDGYTWDIVLNEGINRIRVAPSNPDIIWACSGNNHFDDWRETWIYRSVDRGETWQPVHYAEGGMGFDLQVHPNNADTAYVGVLAFGVLMTRDGGQTWSPHCRNMTGDKVYQLAVTDARELVVSSHSMGLWRLETPFNRWHHMAMTPDRIRVGFAVDPTNPDVITGGYAVAYYSTDGGATWNESNMIGPSTMEGIGFDPSDPIFAYCGRTSVSDSSGFFISMDNGISWLRRTTNNVKFLAVDPFETGTVFATTWTLPGTYALSRSRDFGSTWESLGIPWLIAGMAADPTTPGRFYICYDGTVPVIARTDDQGDTWTTFTMETTVRNLAVSPLTGHVFAAADGLLVSSDTGETWQKTSNGLFMPACRTIGIRVENGEEHYYLGSENSGLYQWLPVDSVHPFVDLMTPDGGEILRYGDTIDIRWRAADNEYVDACDLALSPDSGATWPVVIAAVQGNPGIFQWSVPLVHSSQCRIRITAFDASFNSASDTSTADFTIIAPTFTPSPTPTHTPTSTPTPSPTPTPDKLSMTLAMPAEYFTPGSTCSLTAVIINPQDTQPDVPVLIVLDVAGMYWTAPSWIPIEEGIDSYRYSLSTGYTVIEVLPPFTWPDGIGSASGIQFIGFCCDPGMHGLTSNIDVWEFGYGR